MKILVIDDSQVMRNLHKNILKESNIPEESILEAEDGSKAMNLAAHDEMNMFLVDWNMPGLNGLEFTKAIRAMDEYKRTPIIMITSEAAKYNVVEAIEAGVTDYIVKPIQGNILRDKIKQYLR